MVAIQNAKLKLAFTAKAPLQSVNQFVEISFSPLMRNVMLLRLDVQTVL